MSDLVFHSVRTSELSQPTRSNEQIKKLEAGPVAHQEIQMTTKRLKGIEILTYFGPQRSTGGLKVLTIKLADNI